MQGADAGGHRLEQGAAVFALVPEVRDRHEEVGLGVFRCWRAVGLWMGVELRRRWRGCCGDGDGDAVFDEQAALVHRVIQGAVVEAQDGAQSTVRSNVFDQLGGRDVWPAGRSLAVASHRE